MRLRLAILTGLLLAAAVHAEDLVAPAPTQKNGISLQLPVGWQVQNRDSSRILLAAIAPAHDSDTTGDYQASLTVTIAPGSTVDGDAQQARLARDIANYQVTEKPAPISINELNGVSFGGTFTLGSLKLRSRQYLLTHGNHLYTITVTALASHWTAHAGPTDASIATFTLAPKK